MGDAAEIELFSKPPAKKRRRAAAADVQKHDDAPEKAVSNAQAPLEAGEAVAAAADGEAGEPTFRQLGLSEWLDKVCEGLGMRRPTEVQRGTIPAVLAGRNVIGVAHTGSGKTAAFALPILQKLAKDPFGVFALVLTPTR